MEDILNIDVYELLGITSSTDLKAIKRAYRKKALTCHPDKNPDNPQAAAIFLQLSKALELLLDEDKRASYDKVYNAKKAAKIRHQELDSRRKKLKEDLEAKERLAQFNCNQDRKLAKEIERLRKEGSAQLKKEMESMKQKIEKEKHSKSNSTLRRIKIRWKSDRNDKSNGGYDAEKLSSIFMKYGNIAALIVSQKRNGSALIEFEKHDAALNAFQLEKGFSHNPLKLYWLNHVPELLKRSNMTQQENGCLKLSPSADIDPFRIINSNASDISKQSNSEESNAKTDNDFEALVFAKLREAEDKKRCIVNDISRDK